MDNSLSANLTKFIWIFVVIGQKGQCGRTLFWDRILWRSRWLSEFPGADLVLRTWRIRQYATLMMVSGRMYVDASRVMVYTRRLSSSQVSSHREMLPYHLLLPTIVRGEERTTAHSQMAERVRRRLRRLSENRLRKGQTTARSLKDERKIRLLEIMVIVEGHWNLYG